MKKQKLLASILASPHNVSFSDAKKLVIAFGFRLVRIKGSHHIFVHDEIDKIVNLQSVKGQSKAYQLREFLRLVETYNLTLEGDREGES